MSNSFSDKEPDILTIDSFHGEVIVADIQRNSSTNAKRDIKEPPKQDPSVCTWNFPFMQNCEDPAESKENFKARVARLEKEAYEKGFEQGHKDGLVLEQKKLEEMGKQLELLFSEISNLKPMIYSESEQELTSLGVLIAKKIVREEIRTDRGIIANTVRSAMDFLVDKRKVKIILNPDDMEDAKKLLPDLVKLTKGGNFQLTEDNSVTKGGCILETGFGRINATIEDQFESLEDEIEQQFKSNQGGT
ncbi:FliH/SctL family protein [Thermodesulfobacteriota bacterium]